MMFGPIRALSTLLACLFAPLALALQLEFQAASEADYAEPHDIVLSPDATRLYVADNGNGRIAVLDPLSLVRLATFGEGELSQPHDVVFDRLGRLLVADTGNARVAIYELRGAGATLVDSLTGPFRGPEGVVVLGDDGILVTGAWSHNVVLIRDRKVVAQKSGFASPHDVEIDPDGRIWLADAGNDRIVRLGPDLSILQSLHGAAYQFNGPRYLDFDAAGRMHVADKYTHRIKIIDRDGKLVTVLGGAAAGKGAGLFDRPEGVEIRGRDVWYSDTYNDRIVRYRMD